MPKRIKSYRLIETESNIEQAKIYNLALTGRDKVKYLMMLNRVIKVSILKGNLR